jgi:hypothetical protein
MFLPHACEKLRKKVIISGGRGAEGFLVIFLPLNATAFTFMVICILV